MILVFIVSTLFQGGAIGNGDFFGTEMKDILYDTKQIVGYFKYFWQALYKQIKQRSKQVRSSSLGI